MTAEAVEILAAGLSVSDDLVLAMLKIELAQLQEHKLGLEDQLRGVEDRRKAVAEEIYSIVNGGIMSDKERAENNAYIRKWMGDDWGELEMAR